MNRKYAVVTPLLMVVALSLFSALVSAVEPSNGHDKFCFSEGVSFGMAGGKFVCRKAYVGYCFNWGYVVLDLGDLMKDDCEGVWEICESTVQRCDYYETFQAKWVESTKDTKIEAPEGPLFYDNELSGAGDIRVITFLRDGERALTIVLGYGFIYVGSGSVCIPIRPD
ncbi:hypothetical protein KAS14_01985 [Candidatus Bathyarchaeota archaeon]|nr:hypothetical protein [Candidatus Bathyarchaeota archaeon]